jgi:4-hydroxy-tetrahydrodipicolinate synthase
MFKPYGTIAASPTPMNDDGSINLDGYRKLIDNLINKGMHGILAGGSAGEYSLMSFEERKEMLSCACQHTDKRAFLMAGTGCHRTKDTIELTQYASEAGADCALVITPYYMQTSTQVIIDHYKSIAENSDIGIVLYNYPEVTNVELSPELISELSQIDGVVGIKNTTDMQHTSKLIALTSDNKDFSVLSGYEHLMLPTLAAGGDGAIGVVHNLVPEHIARLYKLIVEDNNIQEANKLNQKLCPLYDALESEVIPGTIKAGLEALGLPGGKSRLPLVSASQAYRDRIKALLIQLNA